MSKPQRYQPYSDEVSNYFYSSLFCDDLDLFLGGTDIHPSFDAAFSEKAVRAAADDKSTESWIRAFAYRRLQEQRCAVPQRILLGVVVELPLPRGLDTLTAYIDGRIRYIHGSGKQIIIEKDIPATRAPRKALFSAAQDVLEELTPLSEPRSPPPVSPNVRVTSIASDGLYVGEANSEQLTTDPLGGPILRATSELMAAAIEYAKANARQ